MKQIKRIAGIYRSEDYKTVLKIMEDAGKLPGEYAIWKTQAEAAEKRMHGLGFSTIRAFIDPTTFPSWCRERGYHIDAKARNEFPTLVAKESAGNA